MRSPRVPSSRPPSPGRSSTRARRNSASTECALLSPSIISIQAAFALHSALHTARPGLRCVMQMHTAVVGAVSSMKCGLLPICQEAMLVGPVAYYNFQVLLCHDGQGEHRSGHSRRRRRGRANRAGARGQEGESPSHDRPCMIPCDFVVVWYVGVVSSDLAPAQSRLRRVRRDGRRDAATRVQHRASMRDPGTTISLE